MRGLERNRKVKQALARGVDADGHFSDEIMRSVERVSVKAVQGLNYGLYQEHVAREQVEFLGLWDCASTTAEQLILELRPLPLVDITDQPLPDLKPNSWPIREPVHFMKLVPLAGGDPRYRILRLKRETPATWEHYQPGFFRFTFVRMEDEQSVAACVMEWWEAFLVAVKCPWPARRGPLRREPRSSRS